MRQKIDKPSVWSLMNLLEQFLVLLCIVAFLMSTGYMIFTLKSL